MIPAATTPDQYVQSALMLLILGSLTSVCYWIYNTATDWFWRQFWVTITVRQPDRSYEWIASYLVLNRHKLMSASNLTLEVKEEGQSNGWHRRRQEETDKEVTEKDLKLLPGEGLHMFPYKGKWIWLTRTIQEPKQNGFFGRAKSFESMTVSMIGRDTKVLEELFMEAYRLYQEAEGENLKIYALEDGWDWRVASSRPPRSMESVVLANNIGQEIVDDVRNFYKSEDWYRGCGIPFRRGVLLYGPPGTGKTSFIQAVAGEVGLNICVVNLSNKSLDDEGLSSRLMDAPAKSIILLEDIDAVFVGRGVATPEEALGGAKSAPSVTFSGLLNALDGVASQEGRILFMTTNHIEKLDPALIRPGRCDVIVKFDLATADQARRMFLRFFPTEKDLANDVQKMLADKAVSPAALQGHFLKNRGEPLKALQTIGTLLVDRESENIAPLQISMWLKRLALPQHYGAKLAKMKLAYVSDLRLLDSGDVLSLMDIKNELHKARVSAFLDGKEEVKQLFALQKTNVIEQLFQKYNSRASKEQLKQFSKYVEPDTLSAFEIENYLAKYVEQPKKALDNIDDLLERGGEADADMVLRRSAMQAIDLSVEDWCKSVGQSQAIEKFAEQNVTDMEQILEFSENDLGDYGIEKAGDKWRVMKDIEKRKQQRELCA